MLFCSCGCKTFHLIEHRRKLFALTQVNLFLTRFIQLRTLNWFLLWMHFFKDPTNSAFCSAAGGTVFSTQTSCPSMEPAVQFGPFGEAHCTCCKGVSIKSSDTGTFFVVGLTLWVTEVTGIQKASSKRDDKTAVTKPPEPSAICGQRRILDCLHTTNCRLYLNS